MRNREGKVLRAGTGDCTNIADQSLRIRLCMDELVLIKKSVNRDGSMNGSNNQD